MILIAVIWALIPPIISKRFVKHWTFQTSFYGGFELVANIVFSLRLILGRDLFIVIRL